jgi:hypothetical protein
MRPGLLEAQRARAANVREMMAAKRVEAVRLWPTMSIRDIACELDVTVAFVTAAGVAAGFPSRPTSHVPGEPRPVKTYFMRAPKPPVRRLTWDIRRAKRVAAE